MLVRGVLSSCETCFYKSDPLLGLTGRPRQFAQHHQGQRDDSKRQRGHAHQHRRRLYRTSAMTEQNASWPQPQLPICKRLWQVAGLDRIGITILPPYIQGLPPMIQGSKLPWRRSRGIRKLSNEIRQQSRG